MLPLKRGASKRNVYAAVMQHGPGCETAARPRLRNCSTVSVVQLYPTPGVFMCKQVSRLGFILIGLLPAIRQWNNVLSSASRLLG